MTEELLVFRYEAIAGGGKPVIPLRLSTTSHATVVAATLAPSLPRTLIAPLWAAAIGLSQGGTVVAQVQTRMSLTSEKWGPEVIIVPVFEAELDDVTATFAEAEDVDWRERDACLVGHDFLCNITVILDGMQGRVLLDTESPFAGE